ncbi:cyclic nucleotide-gated channel beta-1 [Penaeus vannamei]|uniref:cyclic nucleotide-gated channel beta-1 n=1 Tax=Penaeus vannamei TaxID=6689 RepID=UPI00387F8064
MSPTQNQLAEALAQVANQDGKGVRAAAAGDSEASDKDAEAERCALHLVWANRYDVELRRLRAEIQRQKYLLKLLSVDKSSMFTSSFVSLVEYEQRMQEGCAYDCSFDADGVRGPEPASGGDDPARSRASSGSCVEELHCSFPSMDSGVFLPFDDGEAQREASSSSLLDQLEGLMSQPREELTESVEDGLLQECLFPSCESLVECDKEAPSRRSEGPSDECEVPCEIAKVSCSELCARDSPSPRCKGGSVESLHVEEIQRGRTCGGSEGESTAVEENRSVQSLPEENCSVQSLPEENCSVQSLPEENCSVQSLPEENCSVQSLPEENCSVQSLPEENCSVQSLTEENCSVQSLREENCSVQSLREENCSVQSLPEENGLGDTGAQENPEMSSPAVVTRLEESDGAKTSDDPSHKSYVIESEFGWSLVEEAHPVGSCPEEISANSPAEPRRSYPDEDHLERSSEEETECDSSFAESISLEEDQSAEPIGEENSAKPTSEEDRVSGSNADEGKEREKKHTPSSGSCETPAAGQPRKPCAEAHQHDVESEEEPADQERRADALDAKLSGLQHRAQTVSRETADITRLSVESMVDFLGLDNQVSSLLRSVRDTFRQSKIVFALESLCTALEQRLEEEWWAAYDLHLTPSERNYIV